LEQARPTLEQGLDLDSLLRGVEEGVQTVVLIVAVELQSALLVVEVERLRVRGAWVLWLQWPLVAVIVEFVLVVVGFAVAVVVVGVVAVVAGRQLGLVALLGIQLLSVVPCGIVDAHGSIVGDGIRAFLVLYP